MDSDSLTLSAMYTLWRVGIAGAITSTANGTYHPCNLTASQCHDSIGNSRDNPELSGKTK